MGRFFKSIWYILVSPSRLSPIQVIMCSLSKSCTISREMMCSFLNHILFVPNGGCNCVLSLSPTVYLRKRIHNWGQEHTIASSTREKSTCTSCTRINGTSDIMKQCTDSLSLSLTAVANVGHRVLFLVKWCALFLNRVLFLVKWCALFEIMYSLSILCVLFSSGGCNRVLSVSNCVFFEKKNTRLGTECTRLHPPLEKRGHVLVVPESHQCATQP